MSPQQKPDAIRDRVKSLVRIKGRDLAPNPKNWRKHPKAQRDALRTVLAEVGFAGAALARETDEGVVLIDGHLRAEVAPDQEIPVLLLDVTAEESDKILATFDPLTEMAEEDRKKRKALLRELRDLKGQSLEFQQFLATMDGQDVGEMEDPEAQIDRAADLQEKWRTALGQIWIIPSRSMPGASHRVMVGDARLAGDHARLMNGGRASMVWTDPPYGVNYQGKTANALEIQNDSADGLTALLTAAFQATAADAVPSAPFYIAHPAGARSFLFSDALRAAEWRLHETLVWIKDAMVLGPSDHHYRHEPIHYGQTPRKKHRRTAATAYTEAHQPIYYGWTPGDGTPSRGQPGSRWYGGDDQTTVFEVHRPQRSTLHPTMKPPELIARRLGNSSRPGEIVVDPFLGSGSTIIAAEQSARLGYGLELDPKYAAVTLQRLADLGLQPRLETAAVEKQEPQSAGNESTSGSADG